MIIFCSDSGRIYLVRLSGRSAARTEKIFMYHQKIPSYDGAQPFIYAVYCKEDEALAYPVLARMYNEGFRVFCAPSTGVSSDYYKQQRIQSASGVIMFMSSHMAERLRSGDPDVLTAARNPLLRTVILLDSTDVSNNIFAMSVPDHQPYIRENDSAFWLYIYSNDYFDNCRGKWPEKQLLLRDPVYEDISEEVVSEEYRRLQNIMTGQKGGQRDYNPFDPDTIYQNNPGYIQPEPDEFTYEPLERIEIVRTEQDDQFDEVLDLINQAENAVEESRKRTAEATAAAANAAQTAADAVTQQEEELRKAAANKPVHEPIIVTTEPFENPFEQSAAQAEPKAEAEAKPEPAAPAVEAEPKADLIVTPVDAPDAAEEPQAEEPAAELLPEPAPVTQEQIAAAAETIIASAQVLREEEPAAETQSQPVSQPEVQTAAPVAETAAPAVQPEPAPQEIIAQPEKTALIHRQSKARRSSVPVMVRRQQPVVRSKVEVKARLAVHASPAPAATQRSAMHLSPTPVTEGAVPHAISDSITFEQYVRDIARSYVSELLEQPEEQTAAAPAAASAPTSRRHRQRAAAAAETQPQYSIELASAEPEETGESEESKSHRKNRHPHQKGSFFANIINALRNERHQQEETLEDSESNDTGSGDDDNGNSGNNGAAGIDTGTVISDSAPVSDNGIKDNYDSLSGKPENRLPSGGYESTADLQSVVEKFIECNRVPSITVVPRTMIRRYRD